MGEFVCALGVFLFLPFATSESIESKLTKLNAPYTSIFIITFDFEGNGEIHAPQPLQWIAMSFINFALEFSIDLI